MVGGRKPINSKYAGKTHPSGVAFSREGFPIFGPHAIAEVEVEGLTGEYSNDEKLANQKMGFAETPEGFVWHHVEDEKTMQLVPRDLHRRVRHTGGAAIIKRRRRDKTNENQLIDSTKS